ncbi:acetyl-CoA carboxylase biotin carboxyl carrier protein, partial [Bacillus safensis]|nr:acetyl-CoA carboxylase biotin carboxyl carrier protein [Bacillus safensis]
MLKIEEIHELIKLIDDSTIDEFTYENEGAKIKLKKNKEVVQQVAAQAPVAPVQAAPAQQAPKAQAPAQTEAPAQEAAASENLHKITSPMVGTFYAS